LSQRNKLSFRWHQVLDFLKAGSEEEVCKLNE
jgi:hypothetical protein